MCTRTGIAYRAANCTKGLTKLKTRISFGLGYFSSASATLYDSSPATQVFTPIESSSEKNRLWDGGWFWAGMALAFSFCWPVLLHEILQSFYIHDCKKEVNLFCLPTAYIIKPRFFIGTLFSFTSLSSRCIKNKYLNKKNISWNLVVSSVPQKGSPGIQSILPS